MWGGGGGPGRQLLHCKLDCADDDDISPSFL
jgi:hypothetical protein